MNCLVSNSACNNISIIIQIIILHIMCCRYRLGRRLSSDLLCCAISRPKLTRHPSSFVFVFLFADIIRRPRSCGIQNNGAPGAPDGVWIVQGNQISQSGYAIGGHAETALFGHHFSYKNCHLICQVRLGTNVRKIDSEEHLQGGTPARPPTTALATGFMPDRCTTFRSSATRSWVEWAMRSSHPAFIS
eukprot:COSAG06_NODE_238_length_19422_cov_16.417741_19_plen_188_part_00